MIAKVVAHGARPRRGARAPAARARRDDRGDPRRHDQQGLPARPARAARGRRAATTTPAGSTGWPRRATHLPRGGATSRCSQAAVEAYDAEAAIERAVLRLGGARAARASGREIGPPHRAAVRGARRHAARGARASARRRTAIASSGRTIDVGVERLGPLRALADRARPPASASCRSPTADAHLVEVDGVPASHRARRRRRRPGAGAGGRARRSRWRRATRSAAGDRLAVLEAMKMEMPVLAPFAGRVRSVLVTANVQVDAGAPLLVLEPTDVERAEAGRRRRVEFDSLARRRRAARRADAVPRRARRRSRSLILGFDVEPGRRRRRCADAAGRGPPDDDAELRRARGRAARALRRRPRAVRAAGARRRGRRRRRGRARRSTSSPTCARSTRARRACRRGSSSLRRALAHYGVTPRAPARARARRCCASTRRTSASRSRCRLVVAHPRAAARRTPAATAPRRSPARCSTG